MEKNHRKYVKVKEMSCNWNFRVQSFQFTERRLKEDPKNADAQTYLIG